MYLITPKGCIKLFSAILGSKTTILNKRHAWHMINIITVVVRLCSEPPVHTYDNLMKSGFPTSPNRIFPCI